MPDLPFAPLDATAPTPAATTPIPAASAAASTPAATPAPLSQATIGQLAPLSSRLAMDDPWTEGKTREDAAHLRVGDTIDAGLSGHMAMLSMLDCLDHCFLLSLPKMREGQEDRPAQEDRGLDIEGERPGAWPGGLRGAAAD